MKTLIIINFIINVLIIVYMLYKENRFYFEINKTFWKETPYSISLWYKTEIYTDGGFKATCIITIPFRRYKKIENN
jgi:hypothetical protein